ncbi:MAG: SpoIIE family protein phosphatase [Boseongicola sp. SB0664_bin_43]|uniref:SpoIIE family protein phosphatase n=1 Tax=Boseongicola sp. SB0664_bin_43 TaxID=2604844 RepID=A0A6B0Y197_9RHOB|nr:SpoIIE family protein phosphatase [Boseongicola sp. SB0664_bin_43]
MTENSKAHSPRKGRSLRRGITLIAAAALLAVSAIMFTYAEFRKNQVSRRYEAAWIEVQLGLLDTMLDLYRGRLGEVVRQLVVNPEIDTVLSGDGSHDFERVLERARNELRARPEFAVLSASGQVLAAAGDEAGHVNTDKVRTRATEDIRTRIVVSSSGSPFLVYYAPVRRGATVVAQIAAILDIKDGISFFFPGLSGLAFAQATGGLSALSGDLPVFESVLPEPNGEPWHQILSSSDGRRFDVAALPLRDEAGNFAGEFVFLRDISDALEREEVLATLAFSSVLVIVVVSLGLLAQALRLGFRPLGAVVYLLDAMARGETGLRMRYVEPRPEPESNVEGVPEQFAHHSVARQGETSDSSEPTSLAQRSVAEIDTLLDTVERFRASIDARNALIAVQEQLESARRIQQSLLPVDFDLHPDLEFNARMRAAQDGGGDVFAAFPVGAGRGAVVIADVSGKGIAAALFAAQASVVLRSHCQTPENLPEQIQAANNALCQRNPEEMFLTAIVAFITPRTGEVAFVNAGHCPPMIAAPDGQVRLETRPPNLVLGVLPDVDWSLHHLTLSPGESLLLHSDGFDEAQTLEGEILGRESAMEMFGKVIGGAESQDCAEVSERILEEIDQFAGDAPQADDITLMTMRLAG